MLDNTIKDIQDYRRKQNKLKEPQKEKGLPENLLHNNFEYYIKELKKNEPTSDNEFFRTNIIMYEFGDLCRAIVYAQRFKNSDKIMFRDGFKNCDTILSEGKLAMADMITQLRMLCVSLNWSFDELSELGIKHLEERQKDHQRDGWCEVKND